MLRLPIVLTFLAFALAPFALAACGGDDKTATEGEEGARITCRADAFEGDLGLPANFPRPAEFVATSSEQQGPTRIVVGYWESDIGEAYREWKEMVEEAGFDVTFDELEDRDAEVAYKGSGRTGLIALRDRCVEDEVTYVRITNRPE